MKPIKTPESNHNFGPPPGHEATVGDLPCQIIDESGYREIRSVWALSQEERDWIAAGGNVELGVGWIGAFPPVSLNVTDEGVIVRLVKLVRDEPVPRWKRAVCLVFGHRWIASEWHDEGTPLDECARCAAVNA